MATLLLRSTVSAPTFQVRAFSTPPFQPQTCKLTCVAHRNVSCNSSTRKVIAQYELPDKAKTQLKVVKERLWNSLPDSFKQFPWKKVEDQVLQQLPTFGQEALKWSFICWFFLSFSLDVALAISKNHELVMPFGLFAGCLISDFLKETSEELFQHREVKGLKWSFLGPALIFVVLKLISSSFASQSWTFLLHVANGGLMQIVWLWTRSQEENVQMHNIDV